MNTTELLFLPATALVVIGFVTGALFGDWQIVIDVQAITVIGAAVLHLFRSRRGGR